MVFIIGVLWGPVILSALYWQCLVSLARWYGDWQGCALCKLAGLNGVGFFWVKGGLSTLRQMMKVPNEPGLSPNNGLKNAFLSDQSMASKPRKGQAKRFGAKTTSPDGQAGHVMTHVRHRARQEQRQV